MVHHIFLRNFPFPSTIIIYYIVEAMHQFQRNKNEQKKNFPKESSLEHSNWINSKTFSLAAMSYNNKWLNYRKLFLLCQISPGNTTATSNFYNIRLNL